MHVLTHIHYYSPNELQAIVLLILLWHFDIFNKHTLVTWRKTKKRTATCIASKHCAVCVGIWSVFLTLIIFCPQAVMNEMSSYSFFLRTVISMYMNSLGAEVFLARTVHEVLWGFKDPILTKLHTMKPEVDEYFGLMWKVNFFFFKEASLMFLQCKNLKKALACWLLGVTKATDKRLVLSHKRSEIGLLLMEDACTSCLYSNICNRWVTTPTL